MNDAWFCFLTTSAIDPWAEPSGVVASERMPIRTAVSTTGATPVVSSSLTNAVFGDWASASCRVSWGG